MMLFELTIHMNAQMSSVPSRINELTENLDTYKSKYLQHFENGCMTFFQRTAVPISLHAV